jgi:PAS domain-containing protein
MLIPEPFKKNHTAYVNRHLSTGVTKIVGLGNRRLPIVQKNGRLTAILLSVTKVTVGADFMFVGIIQKVQEGIIATNKDGVIIYATDIIEQLFGFSEAELKGENISKLVTGNPISNDSEIESLVYQHSTENSVNSVKLIGAGQVIMPIQTKGNKINISFLKEPARISNTICVCR